MANAVTKHHAADKRGYEAIATHQFGGDVREDRKRQDTDTLK